MDADAHGDGEAVFFEEGLVQLLKPVLLGQGGPQGFLLVVLDVHGGVPEGHDRIADELVQSALVLGDDPGHGRQVVVKEVGDLGGGELFGQGGEAADVRKLDGDLLFLAFQGQGVGVLHDLGDDRRSEVVGKGPVDVALGDFLAPEFDQGQGDEGQPQGDVGVHGRDEESLFLIEKHRAVPHRPAHAEHGQDNP